MCAGAARRRQSIPLLPPSLSHSAARCVRQNAYGANGAMFAVMNAVGMPTPRPGGKINRILNWLGSFKKGFPKAKSHVDDLPAKYAHLGRRYGLRAADAW